MSLVLLIEATEFLVEHSPPWSKSSIIFVVRTQLGIPTTLTELGGDNKFSRYDLVNNMNFNENVTNISQFSGVL